MKQFFRECVDLLFPATVAVAGTALFIVFVCAVIAGPIILILWAVKALFL